MNNVKLKLTKPILSMTSVSDASSLWVLRLIRLFACKNLAVKTITALDELGALWLWQIGRPNGLLLIYIQANGTVNPVGNAETQNQSAPIKFDL